ncbi:helix-turn-helix domain-containing protein [Streptomyces fuscichromogenes]|uniref:helix-turn-helix domain-containing protein n=1 Tax=Streptomyces fuscichromogenes TaxID=1324013 RepID=UPI00380370EA
MATGDDVEQFAALLRRLKDRTGRSYGSLARRLNMNTSTLHRYCAGEAVPQDYAPVERLAAFCGATPEERLDLHRLWLLAVTLRQRPRAGEEAAEPAKTEGALKPTGDERVSGPDSRTAGRAGGGARSVDDGADGIGGDGGDTSGSPPRLDADAPDAALPAPDAPGPGGRESTARWDAVRSTGRPWYRRRRAVVGTATATVLLVTLGSMSALSADGSHDNSAQAPGQSRTTGSDTSHHSSASPSTGVRASGSPGAKGGSSAETQNDAPVPTGVPLAWTADSQIWDGGCGHDYVVAKEPAQVPPPPVQQDAGAWAATQRAVPGRQTTVQISVQGKSSTAVVLTALRVRVVSRGTPVTGNAYAMGQGCGSDLPPRNFSVNLDVDRPIAHARPGNDSGEPVPAVRFPYRVSAEDPEVLQLTATTETYDCKWYLELDWSSQGRTGTVRIDDHGRPFRTSSIKSLPQYWYGTNDHGMRQWVPTDS